MPTWLTITIAVVGAIGTILGILGITAYINERMKLKADKVAKKEEQDAKDLEELRHQRYENDLRKIIRDEMLSVKTDISVINKNINQIRIDLSNNTVGTVTLLRDRMKDILDECSDQGFASTSDKANWSELYNTYEALGGNHFKEYVNGWKTEMEKLPIQKPARRRTNKTDNNNN